MQSLATTHSFSIEAKDKYIENWYICRVDKNSSKNAFELVKLIENNPHFSAVEPDFINIIKPVVCTNPPNDALFATKQWGLNSKKCSPYLFL